eukprot:TRINITY_DN6592_c0_g1_i1.p2 TRINITY_DN6592_c0_g1~~TRINITY_DN6592_c0_g1_i1.p2  ORF type:complete len:322 (-),score=77.39 TRINITY_DN6592_c0_g1_i1:112-1077(-)
MSSSLKLKHQIQKIIAEPPPYVSAKSWAIADGNTGRVFFGKSEHERREIASLTKIMTAYTALRLAYKYGVNLKYEKALVSKKAAKMGGTTAMLEEGDSLYLWDLFHGMLLPSGNDAATAIAEHFGRLIKENSTPTQRVDAKDHRVVLKNPSTQKLFVNEMNKNVKLLRLTQTAFANPHGLNNYYNKSSASNVAKLSSTAMADSNFKAIVSCRSHTCKGMAKDGEDKQWTWTNTNRLLEKGYNGVKTGVTQYAGPCLVSSVVDGEGRYLVFVLLNSKSMEQRWKEIKRLRKWVCSRFAKIENIALKEPSMNKEKLLSMLQHL